MDKEKSTEVGTRSIVTEAQAERVTSERAIVRRRTNAKMIQNILLIWLDANIDEENNAACHNVVIRLQRVIHNVNTFTNGEECFEFIKTIDSNNSKACMIVSGPFGQCIVPRVHEMPQVDSIFVFCDSKKRNLRWANDWSKVKGVFTKITPIYAALKSVAQECEHNAVLMSFMLTGDDDTKKKSDQLDCSFMYTQILTNILLTIKFEPQQFKEFIEYCREEFAGNGEKLVQVTQIEEDYTRKNTPIWWYSYESFLYPMLNTALRQMDVDVIIKMGFFIRDLHRQIDQLHKEQFGGLGSNATFEVYRGQGMFNKDFQQMIKTKGGLMAFNSFLSTSKDRSVSLEFAGRALSKPGCMGILFVMAIDPSKSTTPFASINNVSFFKDAEDEILFSMHSVFRIRNIEMINENDRLYQVDLTLTDDNDEDLRALTTRMNEELEKGTGWDRLGLLLLQMQQSKKAEQVYQFLLEQPSSEIEKAIFYHRFGMAKYGQGEYKEALELYEKALVIRQEVLPSAHPDLAKSYGNIGAVYSSTGDYSNALLYHEKALAIRLQSLSPTHPDLASSYSNIGGVYVGMGDYANALLPLEKALTIRQQSLPPTHPDLASSYMSLGNIYDNMRDYSKALSFHEKALAIRQQSLPSTHPDLAKSYMSIGNVYLKTGDFSAALSAYERALAIRRQSLPSTHPDLARAYIAHGLVYNQMMKYPEAIVFYEKAIEIQEQTLPLTHPHLVTSYGNIGLVYFNMGDYPRALYYYEKKLAIQQQSLPSADSRLASSYNNIGEVYSSMGDYSNALLYHEKALAIRLQSLSPAHPDLASSHNNIGVIYENIGDYSKARSSYQRAVEIGQQSLPLDHPNLQRYKRNCDSVQNLS